VNKPFPTAASAHTHGAPCTVVNQPDVEADGLRFLVTAPASVPPASFLRAVEKMFAVPVTRESEVSCLTRIYIGSMLTAKAGEHDAIRDRYASQLREIDERWLHREVMVNAKERY
jgi:hypothetical protein